MLRPAAPSTTAQHQNLIPYYSAWLTADSAILLALHELVPHIKDNDGYQNDLKKRLEKLQKNLLLFTALQNGFQNQAVRIGTPRAHCTEQALIDEEYHFIRTLVFEVPDWTYNLDSDKAQALLRNNTELSKIFHRPFAAQVTRFVRDLKSQLGIDGWRVVDIDSSEFIKGLGTVLRNTPIDPLDNNEHALALKAYLAAYLCFSKYLSQTEPVEKALSLSVDHRLNVMARGSAFQDSLTEVFAATRTNGVHPYQKELLAAWIMMGPGPFSPHHKEQLDAFYENEAPARDILFQLLEAIHLMPGEGQRPDFLCQKKQAGLLRHIALSVLKSQDLATALRTLKADMSDTEPPLSKILDTHRSLFSNLLSKFIDHPTKTRDSFTRTLESIDSTPESPSDAPALRAQDAHEIETKHTEASAPTPDALYESWKKVREGLSLTYSSLSSVKTTHSQLLKNTLKDIHWVYNHLALCLAQQGALNNQAIRIGTPASVIDEEFNLISHYWSSENPWGIMKKIPPEAFHRPIASEVNEIFYQMSLCYRDQDLGRYGSSHSIYMARALGSALWHTANENERILQLRAYLSFFTSECYQSFSPLTDQDGSQKNLSNMIMLRIQKVLHDISQEITPLGKLKILEDLQDPTQKLLARREILAAWILLGCKPETLRPLLELAYSNSPHEIKARETLWELLNTTDLIGAQNPDRSSQRKQQSLRWNLSMFVFLEPDASLSRTIGNINTSLLPPRNWSNPFSWAVDLHRNPFSAMLETRTATRAKFEAILTQPFRARVAVPGQSPGGPAAGTS